MKKWYVQIAHTTQHGAILRQLVQMLDKTLQNQPLLKNDENQALFDIVVDRCHGESGGEFNQSEKLKSYVQKPPEQIRLARRDHLQRKIHFF